MLSFGLKIKTYSTLACVLLVTTSILDEVIFYLIHLAALGPGVYSASNRNEYQKHKNVSGE
jgi:hypothetical protein